MATQKQVDEASPTSPHKDADDDGTMMYTEVHSPVKPSAPPAEWASEHHNDEKPDDSHTHSATTTQGLVRPDLLPLELLPPSARAKRGLAWLTLKLVPYHVLNFALGVGAFCVVVTGVSLAGSLLPLCCLGVPIYFLMLQLTRIMVAMDIALANTITRSQAAARWNVSDDIDESDPGSTVGRYCELRIAPRLTRFSLRSTVVVVYFATVKFALGIASCIVVCVPFIPIAAEIVSHNTSSDSSYVVGWEVHKFNFGTNPMSFVLAFIAYFIVGVALMHFVGFLSRGATRRVCCVEVVVPSRELVTLPGEV